MSILRRYERTGMPAAGTTDETRTPARLLDGIANFLAPESLRIKAPRGPRNEQLAPVDDPSVKKVKRVLVVVQDEHQTMHIAYVGEWHQSLFMQFERLPATERYRAEIEAALRKVREQYEREHPVACPVTWQGGRCNKRFRSDRGLQIHLRARARRGGLHKQWLEGRKAAT